MELSVTEGASGVIMVSGTAPDAKDITITVYQSDGATEVLSISTPVNEDGIYSASIDMSAGGAEYVVVAKDEASGESKTANLSIGSSQYIASTGSNASSSEETTSEASSFNWGAVALIAGIVVAVIIIAGAFYFARRHKNARQKTL